MLTKRLRRGQRAVFWGLGVNLVLAGGKLAGGMLGHSHALIADGVESFADIFSSLIVWRGMVIAAAPADGDHPYGHGKAEPIAGAIVSTILLLAAAGIALKAFAAILAPQVGPRAFTLAILIGVVLIKECLFRFVLREGNSVDSLAVRSDAWHHRSDAITSLAAAIGITIALIGGRGYESADDVAAIVAAGVVAWNGWRLLRPALDELMDASPNVALGQQIRETASRVTGVCAVEKCLVRKMGYLYYVDMHLEVDPQITVAHGHEIAHQVKDQVRNRWPEVSDVLVHVEPSR